MGELQQQKLSNQIKSDNMMHKQFTYAVVCLRYTDCIFCPDIFVCFNIFHRAYCTHCTHRHNSCQVSDMENSLDNYPTIVHAGTSITVTLVFLTQITQLERIGNAFAWQNNF